MPVPAPLPPPGGCTSIATIPAGTYLCSGTVSFATGVVGVGGPVELYVTAGGAAPTLDFSGAQVNFGGSAANLVVHVVGPGLIVPGDASPGSFTGVIDAPGSTLRSNPCGFSLIGAADVGSVDCVSGSGGPGPTLGTDPSLAAAYSPTWQASSYRDGS
ncbi:MAG TPA: hypothetical protein VMU14_11705 [Acidimicrobiales bacterium]|nr:hypothetical protein [Acidimicrobiales bacterium]